MNADGSYVTRLTHARGQNILPRFSRDGRRIVFSYIHGQRLLAQISVMNADGSHVVRLTGLDGSRFGGAFSPDGSKIAFQMDRAGSSQLFVMHADGSHVTPLTGPLSFATSPVFSSDGGRVFFLANFYGVEEIYTTKVEPRLTRLPVPATRVGPPAPGDESIRSFSLSADGTKIAFEARAQIYSMDADGSNLIRLTDPTLTATGPSFSPDGTKIAFAATWGGGDAQIYTMNADGSNVVRRTYLAGGGYYPDFGPSAPP